MKLYFVHSLRQTSPRLWEYMSLDGLLLSADDVACNYQPALRERLGFSGKIILDSGGFRLLSRGKTFSPEKVVEWQRKVDVDVIVVLDYPLQDGLSPEAAKSRIRRSLENVQLWLDVFPSRRVMPVIHGRSVEELDYAYDLLMEMYGRVFGYLGFGSVAELSRKSLPRMIQVSAYARQRFNGFRLHAFGCGGSSASILTILGFNSVDSASHLHNSRYGLVYDPETSRMCLLAPSKRIKRKPRITLEELFSRCDCPACRNTPREMASWGRRGLLWRAIHNAWHLKRLVKRGVVHPRWRRFLKLAKSLASTAA
ncbi:hypothetical protein DRO48_04065 [Candidatus Bathyarchaeota archaeon]|nr:MAG: hypothetical protein DRO48_04065 [Candidatus Bathyarchaeota archaeon]HDI42187.1 hypothetical protein [Candidatus Bathyarchaeota archaeon]